MFENAIENVQRFTRPIYSISRNYGSTIVQPGATTLFFINDEGWAFTCAHVAKQLIASNELLDRKQKFNVEIEKVKGQKKEKQLRRKLERKFELSKNVTFEIYNNFINCIEGSYNYEIKLHEKLDIALIHFTDFSKLLCDSFPVFAANGADLKQGKYICRLGFPFPEFTNFKYESSIDTIQWTTDGNPGTPQFPIEGMVTRHLNDENSNIIGFELSTPGIRGQSGGPAFDTTGRIWGIQAATAHLDLNFDVNQEVLRNGAKKKVSDSAFLHVGRCIHIDALKSFMTKNGIKFQEG